MYIKIRINRYIVTIAVDSFQQEGGASMEYIVAFIISVTASIAGYYVCRWIEKNNKDS